jgi:hypothetical protein
MGDRGGCVTLFKTRQSHAIGGHEVTGLKTYRGPKRKEQFGVCSLPGYYVPEAAVKQGRLISKVAIFASLDGLLSDTPREPASLGRVYSCVSKSHQTGGKPWSISAIPTKAPSIVPPETHF